MKTLLLALTAASATLFTMGTANAGEKTFVVEFSYQTTDPIAKSYAAMEATAKRECVKQYRSAQYGVLMGDAVDVCAADLMEKAVAKSTNPALAAYHEAQ